jgi:hypothetical protein
MITQVLKLISSVLIICLLCLACHDDKIKSADKSFVVKPTDDSATKAIMETFGLPYPDDLKLDSNALLFYCARSYDTSSLIYLQRNSKGIQGVFYLMLPTYHRFIIDYADQKSKLLFFEGYSFIIDSMTWKNIRTQADTILRFKDSSDKHLHYVDGSRYAIYYNLQYKHGDSNNEILYEGFDKFLKNTFLNEFLRARKPIMQKTK